MEKEEKIFFRYLIFFVILGGVGGLLTGLFFTFFPGSAFIMMVLGIFVGLVIGFIVGTFAKMKVLKNKQDRYKI
ncbi:MAG: hypothetical protein ACK4GJ_00930 [bacterium]